MLKVIDLLPLLTPIDVDEDSLDIFSKCCQRLSANIFGVFDSMKIVEFNRLLFLWKGVNSDGEHFESILPFQESFNFFHVDLLAI
jgi:hypothetical protein